MSCYSASMFGFGGPGGICSGWSVTVLLDDTLSRVRRDMLGAAGVLDPNKKLLFIEHLYAAQHFNMH